MRSRAVLLDSCRGSASCRPASAAPRRSARSCARSAAAPTRSARLSGGCAMLERPPGGVGERRREAPRARGSAPPAAAVPARRWPTSDRDRQPAIAGAIHIRRTTPPSVGVDRGAIGGHPLEQVAPGDEHAEQRAADGIEHHPALMQQEHQSRGTPARALVERGCRARRGSARAAARRGRGWPAIGRPACRRGTRAPAAPASSRAAGDPGRTVQPATNSTTSAGASRLRRRLSRIFQRAIAGRRVGHARAARVGHGRARASARSASRRAPSDAAARRTPGSWTGSRRPAGCRCTAPARAYEPFEEVVAEQRVLRARGRRARPRTRRRRRCPCRRSCPRGTGPDRRPTPRSCTDRCRRGPEKTCAKTGVRVALLDADRDARLEDAVALGHPLHPRRRSAAG